MKASELREKLARGEECILLDVRESEEIAEQPFFVTPPKHYLNIPALPIIFCSKEELREKIFGAVSVPETTRIITLCRSGGRSKRACEQLRLYGWQAENLDGGVLAWGEPV